MKNSSRKAKLTADPSATCNPQTLLDSSNVISSPASGAGPTPSRSRGGPPTDLFGQALVPVNPSRPPASVPDTTTLVTCGPPSTSSSVPEGPRLSLASKLQERLGTIGSPEYMLTWKRRVIAYRKTPTEITRLTIFRLQASARRTSGNGCIGWPTPMAGSPATEEYNEAGNTDSSRKTVALLSGWPTPRSEDSEQTGAHRGNSDTLNSASKTAGWSTPRANEGCQHNSQDNGMALSRQVNAAGWATPRSAEVGHSSGNPDRAMDRKARIEDQVHLASGPTPSGTPALTAMSGAYRLNPRFSLWLQGYPAEWASCGDRAMQSFRNSRRSS